MAINLTYDTSSDPEALAAIEAEDQENYQIGERLEQEQNELLAGKYRSAEELEQAYLELQKKLGAQGQEEQEPEMVKDDEESDPRVDFLMQASSEYDQAGQLSEETLKQFESMSSRDLVDAYIKFQAQFPQEEGATGVALSEAEVNQVQNAAGGAKAYQQMVSWAAENFSAQEIQAFDQVMDSGNMAAIGLAVQALQSRYTDAVGYEGNMLQGKPAQSRDVFRSQAEVVRAMQDPRYENDPAYRQDIFEKLDRSNLQF